VLILLAYSWQRIFQKNGNAENPVKQESIDPA
jgi:hypothetical protein